MVIDCLFIDLKCLGVLSLQETLVNDESVLQLAACNADLSEVLVKLNLAYTAITHESLTDGCLGAFRQLKMCVLDHTILNPELSWSYLKERCKKLEKPRFYGMINVENQV